MVYFKSLKNKGPGKYSFALIPIVTGKIKIPFPITIGIEKSNKC